MTPARALLLAAALLWAAALGRDGFDRWVAATVLPPLVPATSVEVVDRDGRLLRPFTVGDGLWRLEVTPEDVDPDYLDMLIAYEDSRFRGHPGIDVLALGRAAMQAALSGRIVSGGSTLTMQVARLLEDGTTGRWRGKLRQMRVALALERRLDKGEILALYLHHAPFGGNLEGVRAATLAWFGKEPRRLDTAEAALLVALPQSPASRRPDRAPAAARAARNRVLTRMEQVGLIDAPRAAAAKKRPVPNVRRGFPALAPHLARKLRGDTPTRRRHRTTLDATLQTKLERLARDAVRDRGARLSAALLVADHETGEIRAWVGAPDFADTRRRGFLDMTQALRSPGSTLKPLVYGLAFDDGLAHPATLVEDRPTRFGDYAPRNFDHAYLGTITAREALQRSRNIPVVALADALGPARVVAAIERAGVEIEIPGGKPGLAVVLGGAGVRLTGLAQLYAAIASGGTAPQLHALRGEGATDASRVMSPAAAWQVADILADTPPPPGAWRGLAYKTGTSYGHRDAWAVGFDGRHVVAVWLGRADGSAVPGAFGGDIAAPVLFEAFDRLKPTPAPLAPPPEGTLLAGTADLPGPLQQFRPRDAAFEPAGNAPVVAFPPDGAEVETGDAGLALKVERGTAPFTWLADGAPVVVASPRRDQIVDLSRQGPVTVSVIDAKGRSARARVTLR